MLLITKYIKILNKKKFVIVKLDVNKKNLVVYIPVLAKLIIIPIYPTYKVLIALLINFKIFIKYFNFSNIFFVNFIVKLLN